jgi:hypothetical protein
MIVRIWKKNSFIYLVVFCDITIHLYDGGGGGEDDDSGSSKVSRNGLSNLYVSCLQIEGNGLLSQFYRE